MLGVASLLRKYCSLLVSHVSNVLPTATSVGEMSARHFANVTNIISKDVTGMVCTWSSWRQIIVCQVSNMSSFLLSVCYMLYTFSLVAEKLGKSLLYAGLGTEYAKPNQLLNRILCCISATEYQTQSCKIATLSLSYFSSMEMSQGQSTN